MSQNPAKSASKLASGDRSRWISPGPDGKSRKDILRQRGLIAREIRNYFDEQDFIEIDAPLLVHGTTPDSSIGSFEVDGRYLITSTEYQLKRMFACGFERAYTLTKNFRTGDKSTQHNPEFTMLEWARTGINIEAIEHDIEQFICRAHKALHGNLLLKYQGHEIDLTTPWPRLSVAEALTQASGIEVKDFTLPTMQKAIEAAGISIRPQDHEDLIFLLTLLLDHAQKNLGFGKPVFLRDWPSFLTSSALEKAGTDLADRSELFIATVEVSDGFPFMTDYERQKETFARELKRREQESLPAVALDDVYVESLKLGLTDGAGMAMGFDRLVMLLTGQNDIRNVLAFSWDEA